MGTSCCDIDVEEIYNESKIAFSLTNFDNEFYSLLNFSIEELDKKMAECEKKLVKFQEYLLPINFSKS